MANTQQKSAFKREAKKRPVNQKNKKESINHPSHYGGKDNPYEAIKIIEACGLDFSLGNSLKYIIRAGKKEKAKEIEDLKKAAWYLQNKISNLEKKK